MKKICFSSLVLIFIVGNLVSCSKLKDKLQGVNPKYVTTQFLESWKAKDWKTMYKYAHPNIMSKIRNQRLTPAQKNMSDEDLFILEFKTAARRYPHKVLRSYEIKTIPDYRKGDTTLWVRAIINGKNKKIPLTIDGLSLKVDMTKIK